MLRKQLKCLIYVSFESAGTMTCLISKLQGKWRNSYGERRREGGERRKNLFCFFFHAFAAKKRERE